MYILNITHDQYLFFWHFYFFLYIQGLQIKVKYIIVVIHKLLRRLH